MRIHMIIYVFLDIRFGCKASPAIRHRTAEWSVSLWQNITNWNSQSYLVRPFLFVCCCTNSWFGMALKTTTWWVRVCWSRIAFCRKSFPHWPHLYGFSPVWIRMCYFVGKSNSIWVLENHIGTAHFSVMYTWFKMVLWRKKRGQYMHPYGFSFVCIRKCWVKCDCWWNGREIYLWNILLLHTHRTCDERCSMLAFQNIKNKTKINHYDGAIKCIEVETSQIKNNNDDSRCFVWFVCYGKMYLTEAFATFGARIWPWLNVNATVL